MEKEITAIHDSRIGVQRTRVQIPAISMSIKRISLSPQCNEASCQINCLPPNTRFRFLGQWSDPSHRYYVIYLRRIFERLARRPSSLSVFPISLSSSSRRRGRQLVRIYTSALLFHPRCLIFPSLHSNHSSLPFCSLYFPYWWSTLDINLQLVRLDYLF